MLLKYSIDGDLERWWSGYRGNGERQVKAGRVWSDAPLDSHPQQLPFNRRRITFKRRLKNRVNETPECTCTWAYAYDLACVQFHSRRTLTTPTWAKHSSICNTANRGCFACLFRSEICRHVQKHLLDRMKEGCQGMYASDARELWSRGM